jgi:ATP-dependent RNA helicase DDX24/MAK5
MMKKKNIKSTNEMQSTLDALCDKLKFRSKNPKVIDLTVERENGGMMVDTLSEQLIRCKQDEKDLFLYYFIQQKKGESMIIFCNAITATRRLTSLLDFLKIKNYCLHSKMQQKQRLKSLDRFKRGVNNIESGVTDCGSAILVCTDVAARGLDIPCVSNVIHYQCPFNAEVYIHRCGRTARIGKSGDSLTILNPEDNKAFRSICVSLKKGEDAFQQYIIQYNLLEKIRPLIEQAKDLEKDIHKKHQNEKNANWVLKFADDGELELDEDLQLEVHDQLGKKAAGRKQLGEMTKTMKEFAFDDSVHKKRLNKQAQK